MDLFEDNSGLIAKEKNKTEAINSIASNNVSPHYSVPSAQSTIIDKRLKKRLDYLVSRVNVARGEILKKSNAFQIPKDYLVASSGKRLRPILLLCFSNLGLPKFNPSTRCIRAAAAVELLHEASLIHDDILDNSPVRRDRAAVGEQFDVRTATYFGGWVTSLSIAAIAESDPSIKRVFNRSLKSLVQAQLMEELPKPSSFEVHQQRCIDIIQGKTGSLFEIAILTGGLWKNRQI